MIVASSPVAADGTFTLAVAPAHGLTLEAVGAAKTSVVFPRSSGTIDRTFVVHAAGPSFDLGAIHFVGTASTTHFAFKTNATESECDDGKDSTGATCVDDEDDSHGTCPDDDANESGDSSKTDDDGLANDGDATADHNFPADGCTETGDDGSGSGEGSGD
jgi:hypothetical protein